MNSSVAFLLVYLATCLFIGLLFYAIFRKEDELPTYRMTNDAKWKKKYKGMPGMDNEETGIPEPMMPKAPKPYVVRT